MRPFLLNATAFLVAIIATYPSDAVAQERWTELSVSDFPARISEIRFSDGGTINAAGGQCWGAWCVYLDAGEVVASRSWLSREAGDWIIDVNGLRCENDVVGSVECTMGLSMISRNPGCQINGAGIDIGISCPATLRFESAAERAASQEPVWVEIEQ